MPPRPRTPRDDAGVVALVAALRGAKAECEVVLPWGPPLRIGDEAPRFQLTVKDARALRGPVTQLSLARAYVRDDLDIAVVGERALAWADREALNAYADRAMSVLDVRQAVRSGFSPAQALRLGAAVAFAPPTWANERAIRHHYSLDDEFFRMFLDERYQFYSQCLFDGSDVDLEVAAQAKVDDMACALGLEAGMRILDIGGGLGGVAEYCASIGVEVTSLTLSEDSADHMRKRSKENGLAAEVVVEDLLEHGRRGYYDHAIIFGVIEHLPTYRPFCRRLWELLKPEGRLYLDASATKEKYANSAFTRRYTWRGPHSCLALQDMIRELLLHGFSVVGVRGATDDYHRTAREWALRLDRNRDAILARWGAYHYRTFRIYLWGCAHAFRTDRLQAYTLVAERGPKAGPRPRFLRRAGQVAASLR